MTTIHQNSLAGHQSIDDVASQPDDRVRNSGVPDRQDDNAAGSVSGTVNISFTAQMRLRAYQDQRTQLISKPVQEVEKSVPEAVNAIDSPAVSTADKNNFSQGLSNILSEVENNIVQSSEPGYRYLVNMLNNYQNSVEDPQQLKEIMRKEEFYLTRRKPFMESADFQSYSQVLNQFSNIIDRQQYS